MKLFIHEYDMLIYEHVITAGPCKCLQTFVASVPPSSNQRLPSPSPQGTCPHSSGKLDSLASLIQVRPTGAHSPQELATTSHTWIEQNQFFSQLSLL